MRMGIKTASYAEIVYKWIQVDTVAKHVQSSNLWRAACITEENGVCISGQKKTQEHRI